MLNSQYRYTRSYNPVERPRHQEATEPKHQQADSNAPKPRQAVFRILPRNPDVHTPQASDDIHRQYDRSQHCQFPKNVCSLLLPLVHANINLSEVVAVRAGENPIAISVMSTSLDNGGRTSHSDSSSPSWSRYGLEYLPSITQFRSSVQRPSAHCISSQSP